MTNLTKQNIIIFLSLPHEYDDENREFRFENSTDAFINHCYRIN